MKKVLVVAFDNVGTEPIAIRQALESFGVFSANEVYR